MESLIHLINHISQYNIYGDTYNLRLFAQAVYIFYTTHMGHGIWKQYGFRAADFLMLF